MVEVRVRNPQKEWKWGKCTSNDKGTEEKVSIFRFPYNEKEKERWVNALPNKITDLTNEQAYVRNTGQIVISKLKGKRERERPAGPPSVFKGIPNSFSALTLVQKTRNLKKRKTDRESWVSIQK